MSRYVSPSRALRLIPGLDQLLGATPQRLPHRWQQRQCVVGWGRKSSGIKAQALAVQHGQDWLLLEDGFLRSVELGFRSPPLSIVIDDLGIYYDATAPSRLEQLIGAATITHDASRAAALMQLWREQRVSKYNHAADTPDITGLAAGTDAVLVVDQTAGDASLRHGMAGAADFARMLEAALDEHPDATILLKVHPDVIAGHKQGHFSALSPGQATRVRLLARDVHPPALFERCRAVYTVTSQMGFEALIWQRPVRCFGMPFYAGWGVTGDEHPAPNRRTVAPLTALVHAALIDYPRYLDPDTGLAGTPETLIRWIGLQRRMRQRFAAPVHVVGFSAWKKPIARAFLQGSEVVFHKPPGRIPPGSLRAVWGRNEAPAGTGPLLRIEDGFLRSVGLGADLIRPVSWVIDRSGIYFDATAPSDLENLLAQHAFSDEDRQRAAALRERIVGAGLTKYNAGSGSWQRPANGKRVVLVPGQVESDASIRWGAPGIRGNLELLRRVREAEPDAWLVYKPHPDVVAGLRKKGSNEHRAAEFCDEVIADLPMSAVLSQVDAVHVLTSLTGFEALMRGLPVTTWGLPFYAGWGLTDSRETCPRRQRVLTLDELVCGALLLYPTYVSRRSGAFTSAERALDELIEWRRRGVSRMPLWRRGLRWILTLRKR